MNYKPESIWTLQQALELYGFHRWGNDYFSLSENGNVTVKTLNTEVELLKIVNELEERDFQMPVLLRIENILDAQLHRLNTEFHKAIANNNYQGQYRGVYPIKVNQQAQIIEEIADFGARFQHGFEVGSKAEMIAAISNLQEPGSLIICNGYKDEEFIELGLNAIKLGFQCILVVETPKEIPMIIDCSRRMGVSPIIGARIKSTTAVSGHWNTTSGDRSVFGLNSSQLVELTDELRQADMLDCLQLLHCHLGSQLPDIYEIRNGVSEACHYYAELSREGANMNYIDLGGGLAVDYSGWTSNEGHSRNYSLAEYCEDVVDTIIRTLNQFGLQHPTIVTESGRATIAYSSILLFNILDTTRFEPGKLPDEKEELPEVISSMKHIYSLLSPPRLQECYNDANYYRNEARQMFKRGQLSLRHQSLCENLFLDILQKIRAMLPGLDKVPPELEHLDTSLSDIYYGNFSLFQSLPDSWAIDQLFPIAPIHRLDEKPDRQAVLADITCDCDGKIDKFIGTDDVINTLPLHSLNSGEDYYLGVFLVGAYQETLGDLHNLFGDTNVVSVRINNNGSVDIVKEIHGDTIADVLSYVEYDTRQIQLRFRNLAEQAVKEGRITARERQQIIKAFNASMNGYTYYEKEDMEE